jgi:arsenate reductase
VPGFIVAQFVGLLVGVGLLLALYPSVGQAADDVVVEHPTAEHAATA